MTQEETMEALIERGWCQFADARNKYGASEESRSKFAVAWCINGAALRIADGHFEHWRALMFAVGRRLGFFEPVAGQKVMVVQQIQEWNDSRRRKKEDVLAAVRGIEREVR